jgi:type VI secretion system secreted protein VgrG
LIGDDGNPVGGAKYRAVLPDGTIKEGTLDSNGYAKLEKVPPGRVEVTFTVE